MQPLLPLLARYFSVSASSSSLVISLSTMSLAVCMLLTAALAETLGRKTLMLWALGLAGITTLACAVAPNWNSLLVLRVILGIALSGLPAIAMAYINEEFHKSAVPSAMGLYIAGTVLGGMVGRVLSALLAELGGWQTAVASIGFFSCIAWGLFFWLLPPSRNFKAHALNPVYLLQNFLRHLAHPTLRKLFMQGFLLMGCFVALFNYVGFRLEAPPFSLPVGMVSAIFLVYTGGMFSAGMAGRISQFFGIRKGLLLSIGLMLLGVLLCAIPNLVVLVIGMCLFTLAFFAAHSMVSSLVGMNAKTAKAQASALYLCFYYLGSSLIGYTAGYLWQHSGWLALLAMLAGLLVVASSVARKI